MEILNEKFPNQFFQIYDFSEVIVKIEEEEKLKETNSTNGLRNLVEKRKKIKANKRILNINDTNINNNKSTNIDDTEKNETKQKEEENPIVSMYKRMQEEQYFDIRFIIGAVIFGVKPFEEV